jgi:hypothetical protein
VSSAIERDLASEPARRRMDVPPVDLGDNVVIPALSNRQIAELLLEEDAAQHSAVSR